MTVNGRRLQVPPSYPLNCPCSVTGTISPHFLKYNCTVFPHAQERRALMKAGRLPSLQSAYSVNCDMRSRLPPTEARFRFVFPFSSSKCAGRSFSGSSGRRPPPCPYPIPRSIQEIRVRSCRWSPVHRDGSRRHAESKFHKMRHLIYTKICKMKSQDLSCCGARTASYSKAFP